MRCSGLSHFTGMWLLPSSSLSLEVGYAKRDAPTAKHVTCPKSSEGASTEYANLDDSHTQSGNRLAVDL